VPGSEEVIKRKVDLFLTCSCDWPGGCAVPPWNARAGLPMIPASASPGNPLPADGS